MIPIFFKEETNRQLKVTCRTKTLPHDFISIFVLTRSPVGSLPGVWALLWPQGALPLRLSLPAPLRQQDLHVLLPPQQHGVQILLQRERVPDGHAAQPHDHLRRIRTQVSQDNRRQFCSNPCYAHSGTAHTGSSQSPPFWWYEGNRKMNGNLSFNVPVNHLMVVLAAGFRCCCQQTTVGQVISIHPSVSWYMNSYLIMYLMLRISSESGLMASESSKLMMWH